MPRLYLCPDAGTHPSEKLGEVTRYYGQRPSPPGNPEGVHLVGLPKEKDVLEERDVDVGVGRSGPVLTVVVIEGSVWEEKDLPLLVGLLL